MATITDKYFDVETGFHRGYLTVWRADDVSSLSLPPLIFRISKKISPLQPPMAEFTPFLKNMQFFLAQKIPESMNYDDVLKVDLDSLKFKNILTLFGYLNLYIYIRTGFAYQAVERIFITVKRRSN